MELKEIHVEEYCEQVSSECNRKKIQVVSEQVLEALGGLANLYLEAVLYQENVQLEVETWDAFASKYVSTADILKEIENCAGTGKKRSMFVLHYMQKVLSDNFRRYEIFEHGKPLIFKPLGKLKVIDLDKSRYFLTYIDPAASNYEKFLFGDEFIEDEKADEKREFFDEGLT